MAGKLGEDSRIIVVDDLELLKKGGHSVGGYTGGVIVSIDNNNCSNIALILFLGMGRDSVDIHTGKRTFPIIPSAMPLDLVMSDGLLSLNMLILV